jgi:predicted NAD/FAD-binding protein
MFRRSQAADDWTVYQLGTAISGGSRLSDEALDRHCRLFLTRLGAQHVTVHGVQRWNHFPHLPPSAAATHSQLDALQGEDGLWLTGAWWGAATAEDAVAHAIDLADTLPRS